MEIALFVGAVVFLISWATQGRRERKRIEREEREINERFDKEREERLKRYAKEDEEIKARHEKMMNDTRNRKYNTYSYADHDNENEKINIIKDCDYYLCVLGVDVDSGFSDIKSAYRELSKKYHRDRFESYDYRMLRVAEERMKEINEAYSFLKKLYRP